MTTTLPLFWNLSSASKKERIDASVKLVSSLEHFQAQLPQKTAPTTASDDEEDEEDTPPTSDELDSLNAQDVSYSIRRLVRGLASSRESSRLGFAVALTELLSRIDTVTCSQIMNIIKESVRNQGASSGQEERDILFAQLFGIISIIQSGLVIRTRPLPTSASSSKSASSIESFEEIVIWLVELGEKKSWLRESAWFGLSLAVDALHSSEVSWRDEAIEKTLQNLLVKNTVWSTEKVALSLKLQDLYPGRDWKTLLVPTFKNPELLSSSNLSTLSRIFKESTNDEDGIKDPSKAPSGTWKPQLNFSWDIILEQILPGPNSNKAPKGSFHDFYRIVVDESLFSSTSSPQRKFWGFQVFQKCLKRVTEDTLPMLFTKNFMRTWINHLSKKDRYLHKIAQQTALEVQTFVAGNPQLGFALILQLTGINGNQQFDKLTKTKTVESILSSLDAGGIQSYIDHLLMQINEPEGSSIDIQAVNSRRAWVIEQLSSLIRNGKVPKEDAWVMFILNWLTVHGLFIIKKPSSKSAIAQLKTIPSPMFSDELRKSCRSRLLACLSDLSGYTTLVKQDDKTTKVVGVASDGEFWTSKVIGTILLLEKDTKHVSILNEIDEEDRTVFKKARETIVKLQNISGEKADFAKGAELLLLGSLLQSYCSGDDEDADESNALETCIDASTRMLFPEKQKKKKEKAKEESEEIPEPIDILVDTIIGFLEKSTTYMRTIGNQVFSLLCGSLKESTIDLIVSQLERKDPSQLLEDDEDDDEEMESVEADEDEDDKPELDEDENDESDESDDGEVGEDSGEDSNEDEVDLELRNKIEEALKVNGIEPATGETDSEEEELMDDDQMMAIDEQLAEVFRSRANEKKSGKNLDVQREATHFKNRVLDLVEIYVKKQPSSPLLLRFLEPLVDIIANSGKDEKQLSDKCRGILRSRFSKPKESPTEVTVEQVLPTLTSIHTVARKAHAADLLSVLSSCSVYIAKILISLEQEEALVNVYRESLVDFATRNNTGLNTLFFLDFIRRYPAQGWKLREDLLKFSRNAKNAFRQRHFIVILQQLLGLLPSLSENNQEAIDFMSQIKDSIAQWANDAADSKTVLTPSQTNELSKLIILAIRQTKRLAPTKVESIWEPSRWETIQEKCKVDGSKDLSALERFCGQVVRSSAMTPQKAVSKDSKSSKRKAEEVNDTSSPTETTKRKKLKAKNG